MTDAPGAPSGADKLPDMTAPEHRTPVALTVHQQSRALEIELLLVSKVHPAIAGDVEYVRTKIGSCGRRGRLPTTVRNVWRRYGFQNGP